MKKLQGITGLSVVTLLMISCTSNSNVSKAPTPNPSVKAVSVASNPSTPSPSVKVVPKGLIQAINPTTIPISRGRIDPFSSVPVSPIKQSLPAEITQSTKTQASKTQSPNNQGSETRSTKTQSTKTQSPNNQGSETRSTKTQLPKNQNSKTQLPKNQNSKTQLPKNQNSKTQLPKNQNSKTQLPKNQNSKIRTTEVVTKSSSEGQTIIQNQPLLPTPSIDLAKAVQVNGVMQVGGRLSAIVKEPDEKISRSVSEGEYLSKGTVLVKRIQFSSNEEPLVILEQNGVEVIKSVSSTNGPVASIQ